MTGAPSTKASIEAALLAEERAVATFFEALSDVELVTRVGEAWSPAEHLDHLNIAVSAVARGLSAPWWLLLLRFGPATRSSMTYDELRAKYNGLLQGGAGASGRFVPGQSDAPAGDCRPELLERWHRVNRRLRENLASWKEWQLDRIRLPHPILGKLTTREMMFFTIYHGHHHIAAATRRLTPRTGGS